MSRLVIISSAKLEEIIAKGNFHYVANYAALFEEIFVLYWNSSQAKSFSFGNVKLINLAFSPRNTKHKVIRKAKFLKSLLCAPFRIQIFCQKISPARILTADLVFSFWTTLLLKMQGHRIYLVPVTLPDSIYSTGRTISGLPLKIESKLLKLSLLNSFCILIDKRHLGVKEYFQHISPHKIRMVGCNVEAIPPIIHFDPPRAIERHNPEVFRLITTSRLHPEKKLHLLLKAVSELENLGVSFWNLKIIGSGPQMEELLHMASELGLLNKIEFLGWKTPAEIANELRNSDIFISVLTGSALCEAGLAGLPAVVVSDPMMLGWFDDEKEVLFTEYDDYKSLAQGIITLMNEPKLRIKLGTNLNRLLRNLWVMDNVKSSLISAFDFTDMESRQ